VNTAVQPSNMTPGRRIRIAARAVVRFFLPRAVFDSLNLKRRYFCFYYPRLVKSWFVRREPNGRGFGAGASVLSERIQRVNTAIPTKMCWIMTKYGSDKGDFHNYSTIYNNLFAAYGNRPLRIFELGLGTNNPDVPSTMGIYGRPGASLRGWREIFPNALVYGADIDREVLFAEDRIKTFYCDQLDPKSIAELWAQPELQGGMDVIIEDGLHTFDGNVSFLEGSLDKLRPGGFYVIEDIGDQVVEQWYERIEKIYRVRYPGLAFVFVKLPCLEKVPDNNLLIVHRA
jgi:hypothetical protein